MRKEIIYVLVIFLIFTVLIWFSVNVMSIKEEKKEKTKIKYVQIKVFDPTFVANELGYFEEENIEIEFVGNEFGGPQALMAVSSGNADAGLSAITAIINARSSGAKIKSILDAQTAFNDSPLGIWYVLEDSEINSADDLKGRKIGVNTLGASFHYSTLAYLEKNNLSKEDIEFIIIPHPYMEETLRSKQIDVAGMIDPYTTHIESIGGVRILFTQVNATGEKQFSTIFFSEKFLTENSEAVKGFSRAYVKAINFIYNNPEASSEIISKWMGIDKEFLKPHKFTENAIVSEDSVNYWVNILIKNGALEKDKINITDIFTNEFNPYLNKI